MSGVVSTSGEEEAGSVGWDSAGTGEGAVSATARGEVSVVVGVLGVGAATAADGFVLGAGWRTVPEVPVVPDPPETGVRVK